MGVVSLPLLLCTLLVGLLLPCMRAHAAPHLEVIGGTRQEIGEIAQGKHEGRIYITNTGDETLRVISLNSACGCLIGRIECTSVEPGDTCAIVWIMHEMGRRGPSVKTLSLHTNDSANGWTVISFHWECVVDLEGEFGSTYLTLQHDTLHDRWHTERRFTNVSADTLLISPPEVVRLAGLRVKQLLPNQPMRVPPGASFTLSMIVERETSPTDSRDYAIAYGTLQLTTSGRFTPSLELQLLHTP